MPADSPFRLLNLPEKFALLPSEIEVAWQRAIALVHPDRFADKSAVEKRVAEQWATRINDAKALLADPAKRAESLLAIKGVELKKETDTAMAPQFLAEQFRWREEAENGRDITPIVQSRYGALIKEIGQALDEGNDWQTAREKTRELLFIQKIASSLEIHLD